MLKVISFLIMIFVYNSLSIAMENKPYHHLPDGTFRNPEGSPQRDPSFNWSFKIFNKEKRKLNMDIPAGHVINKQEVLENLDHADDSLNLFEQIVANQPYRGRSYI